MTISEKEAQISDFFEYLNACVEDKLLKKEECWNLLTWYKELIQEYPEYTRILDYSPPQQYPDMGFRFIFDDDVKFLEIEYNKGEFTYYIRDRETEFDKNGKFHNMNQLGKYLRQLSLLSVEVD